MTMFNLPYPGEFIESIYMEPHGISCRMLAKYLGGLSSTLNRLIKAQSGISPEMALRLSKVLRRSAERWMAMQNHYDLWKAKQHLDLN